MGRWYGRNTAEVIEDTLKITIQDLKLWGFLTPGEHSITRYFSRYDQPIGHVKITVCINKDCFSFIRFECLIDNKSFSYAHDIEIVPCHYGNYRYYFVCRETGRRVTALYSVGFYYTSRHYHRMTYQCSRDHRRFNELIFRAESLKIRAEYQRKNGHPRKANKLEWEAFDLEQADCRRLMAWGERQISKLESRYSKKHRL
ncbi:MAG: hypothetical protein ABSG94_12140 [Brevinematales bacterium]|jgi:hypothetical protein